MGLNIKLNCCSKFPSKLDLIRKQGILIAALYTFLWSFMLAEGIYLAVRESLSARNRYYGSEHYDDYNDYDRYAYRREIRYPEKIIYDLGLEYGIGFFVLVSLGIVSSILMIVGILKKIKALVAVWLAVFLLNEIAFNLVSIFRINFGDEIMQSVAFCILTIFGIAVLYRDMSREKPETEDEEQPEVEIDDETERFENLPKYNPAYVLPESA